MVSKDPYSQKWKLTQRSQPPLCVWKCRSVASAGPQETISSGGFHSDAYGYGNVKWLSLAVHVDDSAKDMEVDSPERHNPVLRAGQLFAESISIVVLVTCC